MSPEDPGLEDFFAQEATEAAAAAERVQPFQKLLKPGDFFVRAQSDFIIYGEILDPTPDPISEEGLDEEELEEARAEHAFELKLRNQPHMAAYRFSRCFSRICPQGEMGDIHISTVVKVISKESFEKARRANWPTDAGFVGRLT